MGSRKRFSYRNRLFVPIAAIIWSFAIALCIFHHSRSQQYRKNTVITNLDFINTRIVDSYNMGDRDRAIEFLAFIDRYYTNTTYDELSVAVYNVANGELTASAGTPIPPPENLAEIADSPISGSNQLEQAPQYIDDAINAKTFYYKLVPTNDKQYVVQTVMPYNSVLAGKLDVSPFFYIIVFVVTVIITIIVYLFTSHLGKNIVMLREFVDNAVKDPDFNPSSEFPTDELGDISKRIVELHKSRTKAMATIEREHKIALKATEEKNRLKRQLTDNINHELKTPIGIIKGYVDTLLENPDIDTDTRRHFLSKTAAQIKRLTDMLNDISTITRLEEGSQSIPVEKVDFHDVVFTTANDIVESGVNGNMEVVFDIPFDCYIKGNFNLLGNVLSNLAKNAASYSGGTEMGIKLIAENKLFYTFSFYDNGKGLDPTHLSHIFERFYRVDTGRSRKNGGTGLGLPIVKSTIVTLGGSISVRNRAGGGLEFLFTLPKWND